MNTLTPSSSRLVIVLLLALCACGAPDPPKGGPGRSASAPTPDAMGDLEQFGAGVEGTDAVPVAAVLADPAKHAGATRLTGTITSVCKKKGCWMRLGPGEPTVFVKFKDYAFFVPKDCEGRTAILVGELAVKEQSVEEVRHYLEDAGKLEEAKQVTEPRQVVTFMASGVALSRR